MSTKSSPYAFYAFYTLYNTLNEGTHSTASSTDGSLSFAKICNKLYPHQDIDSSSSTSLFITWKKKVRQQSGHGEDYALRGCIGTFAKLPVVSGIEKYSLIAALQDRRFPPIDKKELSQLKCSCNILQDFEKIYDGKTQAGDIFNWEIGTHGIELFFKHPQTGSICSATFLPEVMPEQGWDKEETFLNLIEKAGVYAHAKDILEDYENSFVKVIRYEGKKSAISYDEFMVQLGKLKNEQ